MSMPGSIKRPDGPLKRTALELQGITLPDEGPTASRQSGEGQGPSAAPGMARS